MFLIHITYMYGLMSHPKWTRQLYGRGNYMVKCLAQGHNRHNQSNTLLHVHVERSAKTLHMTYNLPQNLIDKLQRLQNASARLVTLSRRTTHITPTLKSLHHRPYSLQDSPTCFSISTWYFTYLHD